MLFHEKSKKTLNRIMVVVAILVIISMIMLYIPSLSRGF